MNLGKDASSFKYYTMCGLQEGFEPFAVNMNRQITMWFSKRLPTFVNVPKDHSHISVRPPPPARVQLTVALGGKVEMFLVAGR